MEAHLSSPERAQSSLPLQGDFASGMRMDPRPLGVRGDFATGVRGTTAPLSRHAGDFAAGLRSRLHDAVAPATSRSDCAPPMRKRAPEASAATCERMGSCLAGAHPCRRMSRSVLGALRRPVSQRVNGVTGAGPSRPSRAGRCRRALVSISAAVQGIFGNHRDFARAVGAGSLGVTCPLIRGIPRTPPDHRHRLEDVPVAVHDGDHVERRSASLPAEAVQPLDPTDVVAPLLLRAADAMAGRFASRHQVHAIRVHMLLPGQSIAPPRQTRAPGT